MKEYADTSEEWSKLVRKKYQNRCICCSADWGLGAHHVISRRYKVLALYIPNGLSLCTICHNYVESIKGTQRYERVMRILIGWKRLHLLYKMKGESLEPEFEEEIMRSSEVDI